LTTSRGFLLFAELVEARVADKTRYPFNLPAVAALASRLCFHDRATILTGENGSGKSTVMEAVAAAAGFNPEGGSANFRFSTRSSESDLHRCIRLGRSERRPKTGFFFRAESFFNVATEIEALDQVPAPAPPVIEAYGGRSLHEQSHGESFMALVEHRFGADGLYILDEPEAALSVSRQIDLVRHLYDHVTKKGSQVIVATHSPVLMALPGARIYRLGSEGITSAAYEETDAFQLMRDFIADPTKMLVDR
jgi:predicted ATPase